MGGYDTSGEDCSSDNTSYSETKCGTCKKRFRSESAWDRDTRKKGWGCRKHKHCFPYDEILDHARKEYHTRCFVGGCDSKYASGSWKDGDIVDHVEIEHTEWGSSSSGEDSD